MSPHSKPWGGDSSSSPNDQHDDRTAHNKTSRDPDRSKHPKSISSQRTPKKREMTSFLWLSFISLVGWVSSLLAPKCLRFFWPRNKSVKAGNSKRRKSILAEDDKDDFKQQVIHYPRARTYILWYLPSDASSKTCELSCTSGLFGGKVIEKVSPQKLLKCDDSRFRCKTRYSENFEPFLVPVEVPSKLDTFKIHHVW